MEVTSVPLAFCKGIPSVTDGFPSQGPVMQNFDFYLMLARINYWKKNPVELKMIWDTTTFTVMEGKIFLFLSQAEEANMFL